MISMSKWFIRVLSGGIIVHEGAGTDIAKCLYGNAELLFCQVWVAIIIQEMIMHILQYRANKDRDKNNWDIISVLIWVALNYF